jgi:hypothetical protein
MAESTIRLTPNADLSTAMVANVLPHLISGGLPLPCCQIVDAAASLVRVK